MMNYKLGKHIYKNICAVAITILFFCIALSQVVTAIDTVQKPSIPPSSCNILYVGGTGKDNYTTIQEVIDDANS